MPLRMIIWKETRETLIYLWVGLFVFLGLPLIGMFESQLMFSKHYVVAAAPFVATCGGILAVFIAVGATCRDLSPKLMDFWQSRPVSLTSWMLVKFIVGLFVLELACAVPVSVQFVWERNYVDGMESLSPLLLFAMVYSVAFLAGTLLRRTAHAAMFGLGALLLFWFLPTILPSLKWLDVMSLWRQRAFGWPETRYGLWAIAVILVALAGALLAIRGGWQIESGQKMMYGTVAAAVLILFGSISLKLQTNLPQLQTISLQTFMQVHDTTLSGNTCTLYGNDNFMGDRQNATRTVQVTAAGLELGPPVRQYVARYLDAATPAADPDITYCSMKPELPSDSSLNYDDLDSQLKIIDRKSGNERVVATLWKTPHDMTSPHEVIYQQTLFVFDERLLATFDISDPPNPKELSRQPFTFSYRTSRLDGDLPREVVLLPQFPGVPPRGRLELVLKGLWWRTALEGDVACVAGETDSISAYRLTNLTETSATFDRFAEHKFSVIEMMFGRMYSSGLRLRNGLLYTSNYSYGSLTINPSISVFDPNDGLKMIGHFAAPGVGMVEPLADGRAIVAGEKIYLIGPPPKH